MKDECTQTLSIGRMYTDFTSLYREVGHALVATQQGLGRQITGRKNHQTASQFQAVEIRSLIYGLPSVHFPLATCH